MTLKSKALAASLFILLGLAFAKLPTDSNSYLVDSEGNQVAFQDLVRDNGAVMVLFSSDSVCGCKVSTIPAKLFETYAEEKKFLTIFPSASNENTQQTLARYKEYLPGAVYYDPKGHILQKIPISGDVAIVFLDEEGLLLGVLPADLNDPNNLRTGHQLVNR